MSQTQRKVMPISAPSYPNMTFQEISSLLEVLAISVPAEELAKPNANTVQMVYAALLDSLMSASMEMLEGPKAALMGMMEYKEVYNDALQFTMFYRHCRELTDLCGIPQFNMTDLTRPDAARLRSQLSGIMNFAKFREEKSGLQAVLQDRMREQVDKSARLREQLDRIEDEIAEITHKHAQDRPLTEEAKKRNETLHNELLQLRSDQVKLSHEVDDLKKERQSVLELASSKAHEVTSMTTATAQARSRLVQSPDRIKRHISEMQHIVTVERATHAGHQRKARELGNRLEVIGGLEMDLKGLIDLEKGIDEQRTKVEEARRNVMALQARVEGQKIESQSIDARLDQLDRQLVNADEKLKRQQVMQTEMRERTSKALNDLRADFMAKTKERGQHTRERDRLNAELRELNGEIDEFVAVHEQEIKELLQEYWTMRKQAEDYMNTVTVKLGLKLKA